MTDKEALFLYRIEEAEETLADAESMLKGNFSPRSITNRAYYAVFFSVLALFLKSNVDIRTSKHTGVISLFDKEFVKTMKIDKYFSKIFHDLFDARQEGDYRELVIFTVEDSVDHVSKAREFLDHIKSLIK